MCRTARQRRPVSSPQDCLYSTLSPDTGTAPYSSSINLLHISAQHRLTLPCGTHALMRRNRSGASSSTQIPAATLTCTGLRAVSGQRPSEGSCKQLLRAQSKLQDAAGHYKATSSVRTFGLRWSAADAVTQSEQHIDTAYLCNYLSINAVYQHYKAGFSRREQ